jgi:hypothetical protein
MAPALLYALSGPKKVFSGLTLSNGTCYVFARIKIIEAPYKQQVPYRTLIFKLHYKWARVSEASFFFLPTFPYHQ